MTSLWDDSCGSFAQSPETRPWKRHVIDASSRGADGVRLADINKDGLLDIATGWEEGGITRVYIHPGHEKAAENWPAVTVGRTPSVEDAVFCDLDEDGAVDVISCCEGKTRSVFVHWAPKKPDDLLKPDAWKTNPIPATAGRASWMFALPMQVDGKNGDDVILGSKGAGAVVGWLQSPADPRNLAGWKFHQLYKAGWIMSLAQTDIDGDGDRDVVISDRKGKNSGVLWLENPGGNNAGKRWSEHRIGASGREVMFLDVADLDRDGKEDVIAAVKRDEIHWFRGTSEPTKPWPVQVIKVKHAAGTGTAKGVRAGDVDGDGYPDIVYSCEHATPPKRGIVWLSSGEKTGSEKWTVHELAGPEGIKYDRIELLDVDGDGDLDVLTCEERHEGKGIGVFWHENPFAKTQSKTRK